MTFEFVRHTQGCKRLILIFAGWSTGVELYSTLNVNDWDIAVVYDYSDLNFDHTLIGDYTTIWLVAWSLGVLAAANSLPSEKITAAFAINGSLNPVDDSEGIPVDIYEGTIANLDNRNLGKFRRRMSPDAATFKRLFDRDFSDAEITSLRDQLLNLQKLSGKQTCALPWKKVFISDNDRIFPPLNLNRSWEDKNVEIVNLHGAHYYPFEEILSSIIPDTNRIATKFQSALPLYDHHAIAQKKIACTLCELLADRAPRSKGSVLEIGPGSGLLTREYAPILKPEEIDFIDLFELPRFNMAPAEHYHTGNAETIVETLDAKYDLILSASTIQWFSNIPEFLLNCRKLLKQGGILAFSSFTEGNLSELDNYRPSPLHYPSVEEYRTWLSRLFSDFTIETMELPLSFASKRELLMHLKHTGVSASGHLTGSPHSLPASLTTLTYRPILFTATI